MSKLNPISIMSVFTVLLVGTAFAAEALEAPPAETVTVSQEDNEQRPNVTLDGWDYSSISTTVPVPEVRVKATLPSTTTSTTTTTIVLPEGKCSEWYPVALEAGWSVDQLTKVGAIAWAESRCTADIANKTYSYGLMQMEWSAHYTWLESEFGITEREELFDPYTNLVVAKWLYDYAEIHYGCGWQPWYMSGDWC